MKGNQDMQDTLQADESQGAQLNQRCVEFFRFIFLRLWGHGGLLGLEGAQCSSRLIVRRYSRVPFWFIIQLLI
jgi:hypothetical protein